MTRYILIAGCLVLGAWAHAQNAPHEHGKDGLPDWYDPSCCNLQDCRPVENQRDIQPMILLHEPVLRYKPTGSVFPKRLWKVSKDERYHVCIYSDGTPICIYIPAMT